jgi:hypothetical protein
MKQKSEGIKNEIPQNQTVTRLIEIWKGNSTF